MSIAEIKIDIIHKITDLQDDKIIKQIKDILDFELNQDTYLLSEPQQKQILEAREEYLAGNILSEHAANEQIEEWLKGK